MTLSNSIGNFFDDAIGIFSPESALKRKFYRDLIDKKNKRSATYAAAKTSRLTGGWSPIDASVNDLIRASSPQVRARVRQLIRDFPVFSRAVQVLIDTSIGRGLLFQSRATDSTGTKIDKKLTDKIESAFNFWADEADISGKLHFYELMELAKRQELEGGEFLLIKQKVSDRRRFIPFALQAIEPDWLTGYPSTMVSETNAIDQGIEYNKVTGKPVAYHFSDPNSWGKATRVAAENVLHGFHTLRPGQLRGISSFAPGVLLSHDLSEYLDAEIDTAKMAAKYLAFVTKADPSARTAGLLEGTGADEGKKIDEIENAIIEYLGQGESITIASNPKPGANFPPTVKLMLSLFAATTNVPYELLSFDYSGLSYSSARISRNDFARFIKPLIVRHIRRFCSPIFRDFMDQAVMSERLTLKGYFTDPWRYLKAEWQPPGMEHVDPLRETKGLISEMEAGLRSPQEITLARGKDYETLIQEIKRAKELLKDAGLEFGTPSTSVANNPAALEGQKALAGNLPAASTDIETILVDLLDKIDELTIKN